MIKVQTADFDVGQEYAELIAGNTSAGAVVFFVGLVRDFNQDNTVQGLELEHYPAMTEKVLHEIVEQAKARWPIERVRLIHRVGKLAINDQIVFVAVSSKHREASFAAAQFLMDILKTKAPFWKKETTDKGQRWVEANQKDEDGAKRW
ncbi:molybdopterin synthase catalytic subunit MoaE [Saccharobesus litoralis]|uniref:Molybdopterin synthase catalytic subunit n=1 Tax=Saccharobesus litoralis TaxID=2172099 RepID=A0A2S0VVU0_9ALTE|nr:molybdopterin synthase catalytic subunit MoaE [Saccharobesus litoralis]AWB68331.1 molybdopterin synthase catalytic subunit MoaE [Saccharobesus litoralis]